MDIVLKESERVSQRLEQFLDFAAVEKGLLRDRSRRIMDETLKMLRAGGELNGKVKLAGNFRARASDFCQREASSNRSSGTSSRTPSRPCPTGGGCGSIPKAPEERVRIRVADTGKGMTDEDKAHLFEPFYSNFSNGRGLGMATVRRIVDDYDGPDRCRSELDKGTEILITIPCTAGTAGLRY